MSWLWILLGALAGMAGLRYRARLRALRGTGDAPTVDDAALRRILEEGRLSTGGDDGEEGDDEPLDLEEAARAEEEFWEEPWDEPDEYRP